MTTTAQESLERLLATFTVPETDRPLGGPGTSVAVTRKGNGWQVAIRCGFPAVHAGEDLIEALRVHCAAIAASTQIEFVVTSEWPRLGGLLSPREAAAPLRDLRHALHELSDGALKTDLHELYRRAMDARETRLRIAATRPPPARWAIVGVLAILTLLGVGLIHADSRRARRLALGMVAVGISCCFVMLVAYTRPYLGQFAIQPDDLRVLLAEMNEPSPDARLSGL